MSEDKPQILPNESIKLMKMSKSYQWEIKIIGEATQSFKLTDDELNKLDEINKRMEEKYGSN